MRRFSSLRLAAAGTRAILRDRFRRYLPVMHQPPAPRTGNLIRDEQLLDLLLNLDIVCGSDIDRARATYDAALPPEARSAVFRRGDRGGLAAGRVGTDRDSLRDRSAGARRATALAPRLRRSSSSVSRRIRRSARGRAATRTCKALWPRSSAANPGARLPAQPDPRVGFRAPLGSGAVGLADRTVPNFAYGSIDGVF